MTEAITHGDQFLDRSYQVCKCSKCGVVETCTPRFDFYTREADGPTGPLFCYPCLLADGQDLSKFYQTTKFTLE